MSYRIEEKLKVARGKIFQLQNWIIKNKGAVLYPDRTINSIYFDNINYTMYNQSVEGVLPRKKRVELKDTKAKRSAKRISLQ